MIATMTGRRSTVMLTLSCIVLLVAVGLAQTDPLTANSPLQSTVPRCDASSCGPMPMIAVRCADGSSAGYTCQFNEQQQQCALAPPNCESGDMPAPIAAPAISFNGSNPADIPAEPAALYSDLPVFNCSKRECGPNIRLIIRTCPGGRHAHPLCAWLPQHQRCGYRNPDCRFPDPQFFDPASFVMQSTDVLSAEAIDSEGSAAAMTEDRCNGCLLPMHVRLCDNGEAVAPYCRYSEKAGQCLSYEPPCPTTPSNTSRINQIFGPMQTNGFVARPRNGTNNTNASTPIRLVELALSVSLMALAIVSMLAL